MPTGLPVWRNKQSLIDILLLESKFGSDGTVARIFQLF